MYIINVSFVNNLMDYIDQQKMRMKTNSTT